MILIICLEEHIFVYSRETKWIKRKLNSTLYFSRYGGGQDEEGMDYLLQWGGVQNNDFILCGQCVWLNKILVVYSKCGQKETTDVCTSRYILCVIYNYYKKKRVSLTTPSRAHPSVMYGDFLLLYILFIVTIILSSFISLLITFRRYQVKLVWRSTRRTTKELWHFIKKL